MRDTLISMGVYDNAEEAFQNEFKVFRNASNIFDYTNCAIKDVVFLFRGGEDIHPSLYGADRAPESQAPSFVSNRDAFEFEAFRFAIKYGIPMIGICRGSQLLCAFSGGKVIQHVTGHGGSHPINTQDGKILETTSTHHQMMYPWPTQHKLIAWSAPKRSSTYVMSIKDRRDEILAEPEIVFFPKTKSLCIQGHPEYLSQTHPFTMYCNNLVKDYIL